MPEKEILDIGIISELNRYDSIRFRSNAYNKIIKAKMLGLKLSRLGDTLYLYHIDKFNVEVLSEKQFSLPEDCSGLFQYVYLKNLDLSDIDTSDAVFMCKMFLDCDIEVLNLSNFNTSKVITMEEMFKFCRVSELDLSSFDTSNVTDMSKMFSCCTAKKINLSSFNTSRVTSMFSMFNNCEMEHLDLSPFNTRQVRFMHYMFEGCSLSSLDLSSFDTSNTWDLHGMFFGCRVKEGLNLSNFNILTYANIKNMFKSCNTNIVASDPLILKELNRGGIG